MSTRSTYQKTSINFIVINFIPIFLRKTDVSAYDVLQMIDK